MAGKLCELQSFPAVKMSEEEKYKSYGQRPSDLLWEEFFRDPSQWVDNRNSKAGPRHPDFKHKVTKEFLWIDSWSCPSGLVQELRSQCGPQLDNTSIAVPKLNVSAANDVDTLVALLRGCAKNKDLYRGSRIHDDVIKRGLLEECSDALITMYAKCGELGKAKVLLDRHKSKDVITWTALIAGYAREGQGRNALECFECMQCDGIFPDAVTYACVLKACATIQAFDQGMEIHQDIARQGLLQDNIVLGNALLDMYVKFGALSKAQCVLKELPSRDVVSWNTLIAGFVQEGQSEQALSCFRQMYGDGIVPDAVTYTCILKSCASIGATAKGKEIHYDITRQGLPLNNVVLGTALVDMYAKCGNLPEAQCVLEDLPSRNVVSWSALISGYVKESRGEQALECFDWMLNDGILPDAVTCICVIKACVILGDVNRGKLIHGDVLKWGLLQNDLVLGNALVDMYAKCGHLLEAECVLEKLPSRDVVSWSALIAGYAQEGQSEQALWCFGQMQEDGILPDEVTYVCILKACGMIGDAYRGKEIHEAIAKQGLLQNHNVVLGNALVDMHSKCGNLSEAQRVLDELPSRDVVSWTALIAGYAQEGRGEQALNCFERMQHDGIFPNAVTLVCLLKVYSHLGLVEEAHNHFVSMITKYGVRPNLEGYVRMVVLFGRVGHLEKAIRMIQELPTWDYSAIWLAVLGACTEWDDVKTGEWAFKRAVKLDKSNEPAYVLMANIYAAAGRHKSAKSIQAMRFRNREWKEPGLTYWTDSSNTIHTFSAKDTGHTHTQEVDTCTSARHCL